MRAFAMTANALTLMADLIAVVQQRVKATDAKMTLTSVKLGQGYVKMERRVTMSLNSAIRVTVTMATLVKTVKLTLTNVPRVLASTESVLTRSTPTTVFATMDTLTNTAALTSTNAFQIRAKTALVWTQSTPTAAPVILDTLAHIATSILMSVKTPASTAVPRPAA